MYRARVKLTVTQFNKTSGEFGPGVAAPYVKAKLSDLVDISAKQRSKGSPFKLEPEDPPEGVPQKIKIKVDEGYRNGAEITYQLPAGTGANDNYTILGVAFSSRNEENKKEVGRQEFPQVMLNRDEDSSELTITDMCSEVSENKKEFYYGILIQNVNEGTIGIYDPGIVHEPVERST
ncbi:hypothetical protein [Opitutus terrae]|uniref:Uncharacterized protein n=1 Tax=Opitutus terrae (strain DSM 11246 / JCM 15787 / PB90-1) TaxID=452637 RepID=B1ZSA8_OPITP|nr:hypothetical protein [Opitutus terrae]ACB75707.1 hypothetical protein Oter_2425 [Opitutus terrae PB90-1]